MIAEQVVGGVGVGHVDPGGQAGDAGGAGGLPVTTIWSSPVVPMTMTSSAAASSAAPPTHAGEVGVEVAHVGARQVVDRHPVGAAEGGDVDLLDVIEVHDDAPDVAR